MITIWVILALLGLVGWMIYLFNTLVGLSNRADAAWADIDVQLKRRYDLVPNLVETVKGYAAHESGTFEKVATARTAALDTYTPAEKTKSEPPLVAGVHQLLALAEAYPSLKANEEFLSLQHTLTDIEDYLQSARRYYNAVVRDLNTQVQMFPNNLVASLLAVGPREYFQLDNEQEAKPATVSFGARA